VVFSENFQRLCSQHGVSITKAAKDVGIAPTTAYDWITRNAKPRPSTLKKIADYFGVDVSFFDQPFPEPPDLEEPRFIPVHVITSEESQLLHMYSKLTETEKAAVFTLIEMLGRK